MLALMHGLSNLVTDWGGFERLVADLHSTGGEITVERDVELPAKEGGTYRIDVVLRSKQGIYDVMTIVECKWWKERVSRDQITHLKHVRDQVGASKAVCFTGIGFQSGAENVARANDIGLYVVRDMTDEEWGQPGRIVKFYTQFFSAAVQPRFQNARMIVSPQSPPPPQGPIRFFGDCKNPLKRLDGRSAGTLLDVLKRLKRDAYRAAVAERKLFDDGQMGDFYVEVLLQDVRFDGGRLIYIDGYEMLIDNMACDFLFKVRQHPMTIDRAEGFDFALIVEDFVRGDRFTAARRVGAELVQLETLRDPEPSPQEPAIPEETLVNGSIISILLEGFIEFDGIKEAATKALTGIAYQPVLLDP